MTYITVAATLCFYDGVQVFDATDAIGGRYVGLLVDDLPDVGCRYLVVGASPLDLQNFRLGQLDLRSLIENRVGDWFLVHGALDPSQLLELAAQSGSIPDRYLPQPGFVLQARGKI